MDSRARPRSVTMEDVAREAGVSRALVSLVMRESPMVSPVRRALVLEAAERLGYTPNRLASRLASSRTHTIGVFLLGLHNPVFADIYAGIAEGIEGSGEHLMVAVGAAEADAGTDLDPEREAEAIKSFVDLRVDGVLLAGYTGTPESLTALLRGTPAVIITRELSAPGVDSVLADDRLGGSLAVDFLNELGHRRIAHVASRAAAITVTPHGEDRADAATVRFAQRRPEDGLCFEAAEAARRIAGGETESPLLPVAETVRIMQTLDAVRAELVR